jgi:hypothetical protein
MTNPIVFDCPAYSVEQLPVNQDGYTVLQAETKLAARSARGTAIRYLISSVVSYALKSGACPIAQVDNARANGHDLHFIIALGSTLSSTKLAKERLVFVAPGMKVIFEGRRFVIAATHNDNLKLVREG